MDQTEYFAALVRHAARRSAGSATISFLIGPFGAAIACWRLQNAPRPISIIRSADILDCLSTWFSQADEGVAAAWKILFPHEEDAVVSIRRRSKFEVEQILEQSFPAEPAPHPNWLVRRLVGFARDHENRQLLSTLWRSNGADAYDGLHMMAALSQLVPDFPWPALFISTEEEEGSSAADVGRMLERLAVKAPRIPLACQRNELQEADIRALFGETRIAAMLRDGIVRVTSPLSANVVSTEGSDRKDTDLPLAVAKNLARHGGTRNSTELAREAIVAVRRANQVESEEAARQARSAAEQFLFDRLEHHPVTAGRFLLNQQIRVESKHAIDGAERSWEVDLCCRLLDMAIEVDGYYHFQEPEAYRRDRRKDYELQQQGLLVLRFLADDVIPQFEDILARIVHAVRLRATRSKATETS